MRYPRISRLLSSFGLLALGGSQVAHAASGGSYCGKLFCTTATINGTQTIYRLNTTVPFVSFGWIAVGFGNKMAGSSMVIIWVNSDGSVTLSQRQATGHSEPQVVASPASVATVRTDLSSLTGSAIMLSFVQQSSGQTSQSMIYAVGRSKPSSSAVSASLAQHTIYGQFTLDLTQTVPDVPVASAANATSILPLPTQGGGGALASIPYSSTEKMMLAHGFLTALGFCFFLPIGVLQARFLRIWWPRWFKTHWIVQAGLAGPFIAAGGVLGAIAVEDSGAGHFSDMHMRIGAFLCAIYVCQALYGYIIHVVKSPNRKRRPVQNYGHAILGLALIALALYQVWLGLNTEWTYATGRDKPGNGVRTSWIIWTAVLAGAYVVGLALLPKQYRAESGKVQQLDKGSDNDTIQMSAQRSRRASARSLGGRDYFPLQT